MIPILLSIIYSPISNFIFIANELLKYKTLSDIIYEKIQFGFGLNRQ